MSDASNPALRNRETSREGVRRLAASGHLYAVIDACNVPLVPKKVLEIGERLATSLYRGTAEEQFWEVAPYLMTVDESVLEWLSPNTGNEGWGIFIASREALETLRRHLRHFLRVQEPGGAIWFFRFYDPRVLRPFLAACTPEELRTFFGPVLAYGFCGPEPEPAVFIQETSSEAATEQTPAYSFMFRLHETHLAALKPVAEANFSKRLERFIRRECPTSTEQLSDELLTQRVETGIARAKQYGLQLDRNIAMFVALMFEFAPNYDGHPHIRELLLDPTLSPERRMSVIGDEISDEEWDQVEANYDEHSWVLTTKG